MTVKIKKDDPSRLIEIFVDGKSSLKMTYAIIDMIRDIKDWHGVDALKNLTDIMQSASELDSETSQEIIKELRTYINENHTH